MSKKEIKKPGMYPAFLCIEIFFSINHLKPAIRAKIFESFIPSGVWLFSNEVATMRQSRCTAV